MDKSGYVKFEEGDWLGDVWFAEQSFSDRAYQEVAKPDFQKLNTFEKHKRVADILVREIEETPAPCFLLPHMVNFIRSLRLKGGLPTYTINSFEFQLNQIDWLSEEKMAEIRGKLVGRYIPRSSYQTFFPIGQRFYDTPNISISHISPDVDTCVASFLTYLDSFAARVSSVGHYWYVPEGPPRENADIDLIFYQAFGDDVFDILARKDKEVEINSLDLVSQQNIIRKKKSDLSIGVEHERAQNAIIVVDDHGNYVADWRPMDFDPVRAICTRLITMLREYESHFQLGLISLFASKNIKREQLEEFIEKTMQRKLNDCKMAKEFTDKQRINLHRFFLLVLNIAEGYSSTVEDFFVSRAHSQEFKKLHESIKKLSSSKIFDKSGVLVEDRKVLFQQLETLFSTQTKAFQNFFHYLDTLEIALKIKQDVLGFQPSPISHLSSAEEIIGEMKNYTHVSVTYREKEKYFFLGVVHETKIRQKYLGTLNLRDFSNNGEMNVPNYLEIISIIDHHKTNTSTNHPGTILIQDAQSTNAIISRISSKMNDHYSTGGMTLEEIEKQIAEVSGQLDNAQHRRILERLLKRKGAALSKNSYFVSVEREFLELLQCFIAIMDDTDFLNKVTPYDVDVTCEILNRLVSLKSGKEVEIVDFDDLSRSDPHFATFAARRLLQAQHCYTIYRRSGQAKENATEELIRKSVKSGDTSVIFQDRKTLAKYASITQFKRFASNQPLFEKKKVDLQTLWQSKAEEMEKKNPVINLHIMMVSTIHSPEELYSDFPDKKLFQDELWFWIPSNDKKASLQLMQFLESFHTSPKMKFQDLDVHLMGKDSQRYESIIEEAFSRPFEIKQSRNGPSIMVLNVEQKSITSRKAHIASCL